MNFLQKIKTGRLFFNQRKKQETVLGSVPDVIIKFTFADKTYILDEFDLNFSQELNEKGQPGGLPRGGIMSLTISEVPDYSLNEWISKDTLLHDGIITFFSNQDHVSDSALLVISFTDAYCINYHKNIKPKEGGLFTTFTISPRYIKIGNEEFENQWKNSERYTHRVNIYDLNQK